MLDKARLSELGQLLAFLLVLGGCYWGLLRGAENLGYNWHWNRVARYLITVGPEGWQFGPLMLGLWLTLKITAVSLLLSLLIGLLSALMRLSSSPLARFIAKVYLESIRNTPLMIQIFIV